MKKLTINNSRFINIIIVLFFSANVAYSQKEDKQDTIILKGIILEENIPAPGATVVEKGTTNGTITDFNGEFKLKVKKNAQIVVSNVGLQAQEFEVEEYTNIKFDMTSGLVTFCCINHKPSHCATKIKEMQKLTNKNNCTFK
jgi:hypothetical protein